MNELIQNYPEEIRQILAKYPPEYKRSAVMPLLHMVQRETGFIPASVLQDIAEILDISTTEVASIAGFYTLFHQEPGGRYHIQICTDLPCALRGADSFLKAVCEELGVAVGETTTDGLFTVEEIKCVAACHRAPLFQLQGGGEIAYHENQTIEKFRELISDLRRQARVHEEAA